MAKEKTKAVDEVKIVVPETGAEEGFDAAAYVKGTSKVTVVIDQAKGTSTEFTITNS